MNNGKHGEGTRCTKMDADKLANNTPNLSAQAQKFWICEKMLSLSVLSPCFLLCLCWLPIMLQSYTRLDPNRPVQVFGQNCMLSSWRLLGEHQQNRAFFFAKIGLIFQFCVWKGHTYFAKMSKILIRESDTKKTKRRKKVMGEMYEWGQN